VDAETPKDRLSGSLLPERECGCRVRKEIFVDANCFAFERTQLNPACVDASHTRPESAR